jgi:hypothetical protein
MKRSGDGPPKHSASRRCNQQFNSIITATRVASATASAITFAGANTSKAVHVTAFDGAFIVCRIAFEIPFVFKEPVVDQMKSSE